MESGMSIQLHDSITCPEPECYSPVCDSYVRPETLVRICDECNFGTYGGRCIICGSPGTQIYTLLLWIVLIDRLGISDAYYCAECTRLEKDRDGCPKIVNLGASRTDLFYERRRLGELCTIVEPSRYSPHMYTRFQKRLAFCLDSFSLQVHRRTFPCITSQETIYHYG